MARPRRQNPRNRIDQLAAEAERALAERRDALLPSEAALDQAATVKRSDVEGALKFWREANAGTPMAGLLDGPAGESERDG